jgi:exosortase
MTSDSAVQKAARTVPFAQVLWFGSLLVLAYAPVLFSMGKEWFTDDNMGHGVFVPFVAGWVAWQQRDRIMSNAAEGGSLWGLGLLIWGAAQLYLATLGAELFLERTAFIISLCGAIVLLGGFPLLRVVAFPLFLLLFMIRIPAIIFNQITFPLQLFASSVAEQALWSMGIPVLREGNLLHMSQQTLSVVEACSGIRSLLSLSFLSLVYAYFFDSKTWMRPVLLLATLPIAVLANAFRVTLTGVLSEYKGEFAEGAFHMVEGWVIFLIAFVGLIITHAVINRVWRKYRGNA